MSGYTPNAKQHAVLGPLDSRYVDIDALPWIDARPGVRMKVLYKDNDSKHATILFQTEPGTVLTEHEHTGIEQTFVLEGSLEDEHGSCTAGSFVWRPVGSRHTARTPNGAKFIVFFQNSARTLENGRLFPNYDES